MPTLSWLDLTDFGSGMTEGSEICGFGRLTGTHSSTEEVRVGKRCQDPRVTNPDPSKHPNLLGFCHAPLEDGCMERHQPGLEQSWGLACKGVHDFW